MQTLYLPPAGGNQPPHALSVVLNNDRKERKPFIEANTLESSLEEIRQHHVIPVFSKDNEPLISQAEFIELTQEVVHQEFRSEQISGPLVRVSHPQKGRIPEARHKTASELEEWEKTLFFERMAFIVEIPSIRDTIEGHSLSLVVGGVKAYNMDNLGGKRGSDEHFKVFIGFKVSVCTNLCVYSDGFVGDLKVRNIEQLRLGIRQLVRSFDTVSQLTHMEMLQNYTLTEQQFAQLIGRCRMYQHIPTAEKQGIPELLFGDSQISTVIRDYYRNQSFCRVEGGEINLWRLYNLFTESNKASYLDNFLDRGANASTFVHQLAGALENRRSIWFLG